MQYSADKIIHETKFIAKMSCTESVYVCSALLPSLRDCYANVNSSQLLLTEH